MKHEIDEGELIEWLVKEPWEPYAVSGGRESNKRLDVNRKTGVFRVTDHGEIIYEGMNRKEAIAFYNAAH